MFAVMMQMGLLVAVGTAWQQMAPRHIPALAHRRALTDLVFFILLPAMVLDVIWRAPIDHTSVKISLAAISGIVTAAFLMRIALMKVKTTQTQKGALILAAAFPNATYLGLPVTDQVLGSWSNSVALQFDLFACTPVLTTLGILMVHHYSSNGRKVYPLKEVIRIPPLWAVTVAICFNLMDVPQPDMLHNVLKTLSGGVVPLMLIVLGMSIRWESLQPRFLPMLLPVAIISLILVPTEVFFMTQWLAVPHPVSTAVILLSAMPTMVFGIVICERYQLDSALYAASVTLTTVFSIATLSAWYHWLPSN